MLKVDEEGVPRLVQRVSFYKGALALRLFNDKILHLAGDYVLLPEGIAPFGLITKNYDKEYMYDLYHLANKYVKNNMELCFK